MTATTTAPAWRSATRVPYAAPLPAVDRLQATAGDDGGWTVVARVAVDPRDPNLAGHFPGQPIYPGVFVVETLCQAMTQAVPGPPRLRTVTSIRFLAALLGGDEMELTLDVRPTTPAPSDPAAPTTPSDPATPATSAPAGWQVRGVARRTDGTVTAQLRAVFDAGADA
ncbi:3-hydroxyacyl-ACP dehydratase [Micromonospora sp. WMMD987]|uniref:3-hydroxyacyl-ACP dehydratase n=1 Tax=Micromonospora sp. WMMD987 TaxID=3016089 RepID=UPI00249A746D|nr:3-hydroxyacyl-ACP dehydratase [Micromonospora sp. WMMD987]WFE97480.1 3-hydroxyacyl-ACP dehydratase [Micromonospora sp. WMMD987]